MQNSLLLLFYCRFHIVSLVFSFLTGLSSLLGPSGFWYQALPVGVSSLECNNDNNNPVSSTPSVNVGISNGIYLSVGTNAIPRTSCDFWPPICVMIIGMAMPWASVDLGPLGISQYTSEKRIRLPEKHTEMLLHHLSSLSQGGSVITVVAPDEIVNCKEKYGFCLGTLITLVARRKLMGVLSKRFVLLSFLLPLPQVLQFLIPFHQLLVRSHNHLLMLSQPMSHSHSPLQGSESLIMFWHCQKLASLAAPPNPVDIK